MLYIFSIFTAPDVLKGIQNFLQINQDYILLLDTPVESNCFVGNRMLKKTGVEKYTDM